MTELAISSHGTGIEWTHRPGTKGETWNPVRARRVFEGKLRTGWHCEPVTEACKFCYAGRQNEIGFHGGTKLPFKPGHRNDVEIYLDERVLELPLRWQAPRTVFVCSMTDLYGAWVPDAWLDRIHGVMRHAPRHTFIVLTKRPERQRAYLCELPRRERDMACDSILDFATFPLPNVECGVSVCDQTDADAFVPELLATPAVRRFVSYEPALGPVDFTAIDTGSGWVDALQSYIRYPGAMPGSFRNEPIDWPALDWVIAGGESGPNARPAHPDWFRSVRDQCAAADVPFFFKQWGEWVPLIDAFDHGMTGHQIARARVITNDGFDFIRAGRRRAGRLLDGVEHNGFPVTPVASGARSERAA